MYGGCWAGQRAHAVSALYSAKLEFDTVSHDMAKCARALRHARSVDLNMGSPT
jgi:hypothetical protein